MLKIDDNDDDDDDDHEGDDDDDDYDVFFSSQRISNGGMDNVAFYAQKGCKLESDLF